MKEFERLYVKYPTRAATIAPILSKFGANTNIISLYLRGIISAVYDSITGTSPSTPNIPKTIPKIIRINEGNFARLSVLKPAKTDAKTSNMVPTEYSDIVMKKVVFLPNFLSENNESIKLPASVANVGVSRNNTLFILG